MKKKKTAKPSTVTTTMMTRTRIDQAAMTTTQWKAFVSTVKTLKAKTLHPNYDDFVMAHMMSMHQMQAHARYTFLPWHREFLFHFENALSAIDSTVTLPYWDWTTSRTIPDTLADAAEWGVTRAMQRGDALPASLADEIATVMSRSTYGSFHDTINGPHGEVHVLIGGWDNATNRPTGEMADIERSPRDVLFWLHHAFLDKLWADWSAIPANAGQLPPDGTMPNTNVNARLLPTTLFTHTSRQVFSTTDLGYRYQ
jgi:tyrosinase